jgi:hypothetical protein
LCSTRPDFANATASVASRPVHNTDSKRRVDIAGHLILPFGTATKADINRIQLVRVAAGGVRLESDVPVVHIRLTD